MDSDRRNQEQLTEAEQNEYRELYYRLTRIYPDRSYEAPQWAFQDHHSRGHLALLREEIAAAEMQNEGSEGKSREQYLDQLTAEAARGRMLTQAEIEEIQALYERREAEARENESDDFENEPEI